MMFGIPDMIDYIMVGIVFFIFWTIYRTVLAARQGRQNMSAVLSRSNEIAAQAHIDAERMIALLEHIKGQLDAGRPA